jgi:hypothetical protein
MRDFMLLLLACWLAFVTANAFAADAEPGYRDEAQSAQREFTSKANSIDALLSAYRNMAPAEQVDALQQAVSGMLTQARALYHQGDIPGGRALLDQAYARVRSTIVQNRDGLTVTNQRGAGDQYEIRSNESGLQRAYRSRLESIDALFAAYVRVTQEKARPGKANLMASNLGQLKGRADDAFRRGNVDAGMAMLDDAYKLVKVALSALREGETLTRSLNFANAQEEYAYYLEKTASQMEAIEIMLEVNAAHPRNMLLQSLLQGARLQLDEAAGRAANGRHDEALPIMDRVFSRLQSGLIMSLSAP